MEKLKQVLACVVDTIVVEARPHLALLLRARGFLQCSLRGGGRNTVRTQTPQVTLCGCIRGSRVRSRDCTCGRETGQRKASPRSLRAETLVLHGLGHPEYVFEIRGFIRNARAPPALTGGRPQGADEMRPSSSLRGCHVRIGRRLTDVDRPGDRAGLEALPGRVDTKRGFPDDLRKG